MDVAVVVKEVVVILGQQQIWRCISMMVVIISLTTMAIQWGRSHRAVTYMRKAVLQHMDLSELGQRVLILSPHPDDETLACGGLVAMLKRRGACVKVVFVTLGEGFTIAIERQYRKVRIGVKDRLRFARLRQREAMMALRKLGVTDSNEALFLGLPETVLAKIWLKYWTRENLCYARAINSYNSHPISPHQPTIPLCADAIIDTLENIIRQFRPTSIFIPHRHDDHVAHWATNMFAHAALLESRLAGDVSPSIPIFEYLVHYGTYPAPQGEFRRLPLAPPKMLWKFSAGSWVSIPLDREAIDCKARAITAYSSQRALTKRFMSSFIRRTEVFELVNAVRSLTHFAYIPDRLHEPMFSIFRPSGDLRSLLVQFSPGGLVFTMRTRVCPSRRVNYRVHIFTPRSKFNAQRKHIVVATRPERGSANLNGEERKTAILLDRKGKSITIALPANAVPDSPQWMLNAEVISGPFLIDRTAPIIVDDSERLKPIQRGRTNALSHGNLTRVTSTSTRTF